MQTLPAEQTNSGKLPRGNSAVAITGDNNDLAALLAAGPKALKKFRCAGSDGEHRSRQKHA
jgi:hypothetical protein